MGCRSSKSGSVIKQCHEIKDRNGDAGTEKRNTIARLSSTNQREITVEEAYVLKRTWHYMTKDLQGNGLQVFLRIFELCPATQKLFKVENVHHSDLARSVLIKAHGARFMKAVGAVIDNLDDIGKKDNQLTQLLIGLGQHHVQYSEFKSQYFEAFYEALMFQWERIMGEMFTPQVSDTWSRLFTYLMQKLTEGYNTPIEKRKEFDFKLVE